MQDQKNSVLLSQLRLCTQQFNLPDGSGSQSPKRTLSAPPSPLAESEDQIPEMLARVHVLLSSHAVQDFRHQCLSGISKAPIPDVPDRKDEEEQKADRGSRMHKEDQEGGANNGQKECARDKR